MLLSFVHSIKICLIEYWFPHGHFGGGSSLRMKKWVSRVCPMRSRVRVVSSLLVLLGSSFFSFRILHHNTKYTLTIPIYSNVTYYLMQKEKPTKYTITIPIKRKIMIPEESYYAQIQKPKTSIIQLSLIGILFEMRLLNLRIIFLFIADFFPHLGSFLCCFFFTTFRLTMEGSNYWGYGYKTQHSYPRSRLITWRRPEVKFGRNVVKKKQHKKLLRGKKSAIDKENWFSQ